MAIIHEIMDVLGEAAIEVAWEKAKASGKTEPTLAELNNSFVPFFCEPANYKRIVKPKNKVKFKLEILSD